MSAANRRRQRARMRYCPATADAKAHARRVTHQSDGVGRATADVIIGILKNGLKSGQGVSGVKFPQRDRGLTTHQRVRVLSPSISPGTTEVSPYLASRYMTTRREAGRILFRW